MTGQPVDVVVVGAGLSGLALAEALVRAGRSVVLLEARGRVGGRVLTERVAGGAFDLGPAWIWPHDRRMLALVERLGLGLFGQHAQGRLVFEAPDGAVRRDLDMATMGGALRVAGGLGGVADALAGLLPDNALKFNHSVARIELLDGAVRVAGPWGMLEAGRVVLGLPPRLVAGLEIAPALPAVLLAELAATPTWMAGQAKLVAVYDRPFWRESGLSGDAISHRGPLVEIHDATDEVTGKAALFGFVAPGAGSHPQLREAGLAQLARLFGQQAAAPLDVLVKDWSGEAETATRADLTPPVGHPAYGLSSIAPHPRLTLAGTEAAPTCGGFLEGALEAAEVALGRLMEG